MNIIISNYIDNKWKTIIDSDNYLASIDSLRKTLSLSKEAVISKALPGKSPLWSSIFKNIFSLKPRKKRTFIIVSLHIAINCLWCIGITVFLILKSIPELIGGLVDGGGCLSLISGSAMLLYFIMRFPMFSISIFVLVYLITFAIECSEKIKILSLLDLIKNVERAENALNSSGYNESMEKIILEESLKDKQYVKRVEDLHHEFSGIAHEIESSLIRVIAK